MLFTNGKPACSLAVMGLVVPRSQRLQCRILPISAETPFQLEHPCPCESIESNMMLSLVTGTTHTHTHTPSVDFLFRLLLARLSGPKRPSLSRPRTRERENS